MGRKHRLTTRKYRDAPQKSVPLEVLRKAVKLPKNWYDHSDTPSAIRLCKIYCQSESTQPLITRSIVIGADCSWKVFVHSLEVDTCPALSTIPPYLNNVSTAELVNLVDKLNVCAGHPEAKFIDFVSKRKGKLLNRSGDVAASIDEYAPVCLNGEMFQKTIRTSQCELIVHGQKCRSCTNYRRTLRVLCDRWLKRDSEEVSSSSSHTNNRYMNTPEKVAKMEKMRCNIKIAASEIRRLRKKVRSLIDKSDPIDDEFHQDLRSIVTENTDKIHQTFPEGTFRRVFWDQQLANASKKNSRQYRWHPLMIKWALNIKLMSSAAYHAIRSSGFITLPSERTLRDYTNYIKSVPGYQQEVLELMKKESKCEELPSNTSVFSLMK